MQNRSVRAVREIVIVNVVIEDVNRLGGIIASDERDLSLLNYISCKDDSGRHVAIEI